MALNSTADPSPGSQIALRPDILNDRKSLFHCFYASSDTAIQQIQNSIKDPVNLQQILTYAVAYIDQGVSVSNDERKQYEILVKRYGAAEEKIKKDQGKLQVLNEKLKTQDARIIELEIKLAAHERVYPKIRPVSNTEAPQGQVSLTPVEAQLVNARQQLAEKTSLLEENHEKYEHMLVVEKQAKDIAEREKVALEARVVALTQEVLTLQKSLAQVHGQLEEAKHHLDVDGHIISGVQEERDNLKTLFNKKMVEVKSLGDELQLVRTELKTATEEHLLFEGKHKDCQKRLEEVVRQYEALKEEKRVLEEEHKTCQAAQPKPSADEEPPEDLSKPVQPNKVTLKNPIKIAGSLRGTRKEIDDKFWEVNVPFPITIFGYKSSKIFVSDNGTICLDQATHARDKREGERLPHYDRMPVYSLFPYWTDLLIAKDMPHGIFWEVTGASPNRSLSIEWYVTRYQHEEQYFHFKVVVDEASPNVVAFEYYDVRDKGAKGTIGVQGPKNAHLQFSYNKAKLYPGLRLVFDTAKNNITESRCEVPQ